MLHLSPGRGLSISLSLALLCLCSVLVSSLPSASHSSHSPAEPDQQADYPGSRNIIITMTMTSTITMSLPRCAWAATEGWTMTTPGQSLTTRSMAAQSCQRARSLSMLQTWSINASAVSSLCQTVVSTQSPCRMVFSMLLVQRFFKI